MAWNRLLVQFWFHGITTVYHINHHGRRHLGRHPASARKENIMAHLFKKAEAGAQGHVPQALA